MTEEKNGYKSFVGSWGVFAFHEQSRFKQSGDDRPSLSVHDFLHI